ncbi:hypothetical protein NOG11_07035 [Parvularcula sp. BGMRC 0090]|uniref:Uncharacterized protein n=2 Tax=Parvularcula maris TaxID=2965077 RepID=A0A9X2RHR4_9PROT|nr:hypothetical protein [Parvularcula maris]
MNAAYRYWRTIGWRPHCYSCLDLVVGLSHRDEIAALIEERRIQRFLLRQNLIDALGPIGRAEGVTAFEALLLRDRRLAAPTITTGSHTALWAMHLGFRKIVLMGIDGNYREVVVGAERREEHELEIVKECENPNYFFEGYQRPGDRYNLPNPRPGLHTEGWAQAAKALQSENVEVVNANLRSEVGYFPFSELSRSAQWQSEKIPARSFLPEPTPAEPSPPPSRLRKLQADLLPIAALGMLVLAGSAAVLTGGSLLVSAALLISLFLNLILGALFLTNRRAVVERLSAQDEELITLHRRLVEVERPTLPLSSPRELQPDEDLKDSSAAGS